MVMQYKALILAVLVLINSQYASKMHANKQLVNSQYVFPNLNCYPKYNHVRQKSEL